MDKDNDEIRISRDEFKRASEAGRQIFNAILTTAIEEHRKKRRLFIRAAIVLAAVLFIGYTVVFNLREKHREEMAKKDVEIKKHGAEIGRLKTELEKFKDVAALSGGSALDFWPRVVKKANDELGGYLASEKFIPLRAIARKPGICFYGSAESAASQNPDQTVGYMNTWVPYYVFDRKGDAIKVGDGASTKEPDRKWVYAGDCFCWATRECLNLENGFTLYRTLDDITSGQKPVEAAYRYSFSDHFVTDKSEAARFRIAALPVLTRKDSTMWCVVRPEGGRQGYEVCWLQWAGKDGTACLRIRTTRRELETYLAGLQRLLREYRNPETKDKAHDDLFRTGIDYVTKGDHSAKSERSMLKTRLEGVKEVADLFGFMQRPIENDIQYDLVTKKALKILVLSSTDGFWDVYDVAYIETEQLP